MRTSSLQKPGKREYVNGEKQVIEEMILNALRTLPPSKIGSTVVKSPYLYHFDYATHTQILEDLPAAQDLKSYIIAQKHSFPESLARSIGRGLGEWLRAFHAWTEDDARSDLKGRMCADRFMAELKFTVNYDNMIQTVQKFPGALKESRGVFEKVKEMAREEIGKPHGEGFGLIHGDFWTGNALIQSTVLDRQQQRPSPTPTLFITDWELSHCGPQALDMGQMIGELYMLKHFKNLDAGLWIIQEFIEGYRPALTVDMAFRAAIHVGVHLIAWGSSVQGWGTEEQVEDVVKVGRDFVVKGWERDLAWFKKSALECLFSGEL